MDFLEMEDRILREYLAEACATFDNSFFDN